ncbi:MAG: hypothetical protein DLM52_01570 [Chthoniobacterales bacterium]|nr:MAG: hypothetical protein DLM52_01570 [Chthoniobacterales bacterium]
MKTDRLRSRTSCRVLLGFGVLLLVPGLARAQEASRSVEQVYQFDERGDAKIEFNFQLGKAQWEVWKARFGEHPDEMLRTINHDMAAAVIEDFGLDKDDTHRRATARFKARALAQYRGNGQFEIPIPKTMKLVTGSGLEWAFTSSMPEKTPQGTGIVNMTYRAKLPAKAHDAHIVNGNDFSRLAYTLEVSPSKPKTLLYSGIGLLIAAVALALVGMRAGGREMPPRLPPMTDAPTALPPR